MIYQYFPNADIFESYSLIDNFDIVSQFYRDDSVTGTWTVPKLELIKPNGQEIVGDFPSLIDFYSAPIFSEKAWNILKPSLFDFSEALPVFTNS